MPPKRRRGLTLEAAEGAVSPSPPPLLDRIRNMEEFAALGQYLFMFGVSALKLPDFGREELETELLAPQSKLVQQIQLALIKMVTSNPRLLIDQFDEQARKQYLLLKSDANPFESDDEVAKSFVDMDIPTKIRVLHQLSEWTFNRPNQIREKMGDVDLSEELTWRMDPVGFDCQENTYYILDDNRLYRRTPWKEVAMPTKKKTQAYKGRKRRRVSAAVDDSDENQVEVDQGRKWSCICISLQDWEAFVMSLKPSKDQDESALYEYLKEDVLPEISRAEEVRQKKLLDMEKERQKQEAVANRKRSSRIDEKMARRKEEEEKAAETRRQGELLRKIQAEERKRGKERDARLAARERENKAREKRLQAQEFGSRATSCDDSSVSGRRSSARVQTRRSQRSLSNEESDWVFDCRCGVHGIQYEDGSKIIACDKCDIWQHLACQNLPLSFTEGDFTCERCRSREAANSSRVTIKLRIGPSTMISSMDMPKGQDGNRSSIALKVSDQPRGLPLASGHIGGWEQGYSEPLVNLGTPAPGNLQINGVTNSGGGVGEGSAQASADFLLLMADPGHGTSESQQPGSGNTDSTPGLNDQRPGRLISHEDKVKTQLQPPEFSKGTSVPGGIADRPPSPEKPSTVTPFTENSNCTGYNLSENNDAHSYHEHTHTQSILTGSATPANA